MNDNGKKKMSVETMTPESSQESVRMNECIRPTTNKFLDQYSTDMKNGKWVLNGVPIIFSDTGALIDGQHRLLACIRAGVPFKTYVMRGVTASEALQSIDVGNKRGKGDFLAFHGVKNGSAVASAALGFHKIADAQPTRSKGYKFRSSETLHSHAALLLYVQEHPGIEMSVSQTREYGTLLTGWCSVEIAASSHAIFSELIDSAKADEFLLGFATGAELGLSSPIYKVRERLKREAMSIAHLSAFAKTVLLIRAWNFWITGHAMLQMTIGKASMLRIPGVLGPDDELAKQTTRRGSDARRRADKKRGKNQ